MGFPLVYEFTVTDKTTSKVIFAFLGNENDSPNWIGPSHSETKQLVTDPIICRRFTYTKFQDANVNEAIIERLEGRPEKFNSNVLNMRKAVKSQWPKPVSGPVPPEAIIDKATRLVGQMVTPQYFMLAYFEFMSGNLSLWNDLEKKYKKMKSDNDIKSKDLIII